MGKPTLEQHDSMPDILGSTDFRFTFSRVPGSLGIDLEKFALNCTQAVIPGITINKMEQRFAGGHKLNYGATSTFSGVAAMNFLERADSQTIKAMRTWLEAVRGTSSGNSIGYKKDYAVVGRLEIFDSPGNTAMELTLHNVFPQEFPEVQLDSTTEAQQIQYPISFNYDWWKVTSVPLG